VGIGKKYFATHILYIIYVKNLFNYINDCHTRVLLHFDLFRF